MRVPEMGSTDLTSRGFYDFDPKICHGHFCLSETEFANFRFGLTE